MSISSDFLLLLGAVYKLTYYS